MNQRHTVLTLGMAFLLVLVVLIGTRGIGRGPVPRHSSFGRGSTTIAFVHGLGSRPEHWLPVGRHLARHHRIVLIELPGHGDSPMPEPFSLERATEGLTQALAAETHGPVVLVGHSIGGLVATAATLADPGRVRALVLIETALKPQVTLIERRQLMTGLDENYRELLRSAYTAFGRDSAQGSALYEEVVELDSTSIKRWIRLALTADLSRRAAALQVPVLALLAERTWTRQESWQEIASALGYGLVPNVRGQRFAESGHFLMLDHPAEVAAAIERFADHPDGGPGVARVTGGEAERLSWSAQRALP